MRCDVCSNRGEPSGEDPDYPRPVPTKVLLSPIDTSNPFVLQLERSLPDSIVVSRFSWKRALMGRYDVLHLHWPERVVRGRGRTDRRVRQILTVILLSRLTLLNTAVIRTNHNAEPHDPATGIESWLLRLVDRRTDVWVHLASADLEHADDHAHVVIPHGHYRDWYNFAQAGLPQGETLLYFGRIRPYKGVDGLLEAVRSMGSDRPFHLRLAGRPTTPELQVKLDQFVEGTKNVSASLRFIEDDELIHEIDSARVVCLPYQSMGNSGALLLALSGGRPVIAPRTPTNVELRNEVGNDWMHLYDEPLTSPKLRSLWVEACRAASAGPPRLGARSWDLLGPKYASAYERAIKVRKGQPRARVASRLRLSRK